MPRLVPRQPRIRLDPDAYKAICKEVLSRDSWRCQNCGAAENLQVHHIQPRSTLLYSRPHSTACCRGWQLWPGFANRKGDHSRISSVRSVEAAESSSEVVVSQADSLVGGGVSVDRLDRLLHKHHS